MVDLLIIILKHTRSQWTNKCTKQCFFMFFFFFYKFREKNEIFIRFQPNPHYKIGTFLNILIYYLKITRQIIFSNIFLDKNQMAWSRSLRTKSSVRSWHRAKKAVPEIRPKPSYIVPGWSNKIRIPSDPICMHFQV